MRCWFIPLVKADLFRLFANFLQTPAIIQRLFMQQSPTAETVINYDSLSDAQDWQSPRFEKNLWKSSSWGLTFWNKVWTLGKKFQLLLGNEVMINMNCNLFLPCHPKFFQLFATNLFRHARFQNFFCQSVRNAGKSLTIWKFTPTCTKHLGILSFLSCAFWNRRAKRNEA